MLSVRHADHLGRNDRYVFGGQHADEVEDFAGAVMNPNSLDIAGIHAAILSLLFASLFAYGLYLYTTLQSIDEDVLRQAERVNEILVRNSYGLGAGWRDHLENHGSNRRDLLQELQLSRYMKMN